MASLAARWVSPAQKKVLAALSPAQILSADLAVEKIVEILTMAPGNGAAIGGVKVIAGDGWFAARPSGTEDIHKIYAESLPGAEHPELIQAQAREFVGAAMA